MIAFIILTIGFGLILYGLSPLSGSSPLEGYISERGCIAGLIGIVIVTVVGVVKVLS